MLQRWRHGVRPESCDRRDGMAIKEGWTGRVYEDFGVGDVYRHPVGRTVITADNI